MCTHDTYYIYAQYVQYVYYLPAYGVYLLPWWLLWRSDKINFLCCFGIMSAPAPCHTGCVLENFLLLGADCGLGLSTAYGGWGFIVDTLLATGGPRVKQWRTASELSISLLHYITIKYCIKKDIKSTCKDFDSLQFVLFLTIFLLFLFLQNNT